MAVYAPKDASSRSPAKVASLAVPLSESPSGAAPMKGLAVDGAVWKLDPVLAGRDGTVPYLGRNGISESYSPETIVRKDLYVCENQQDADRSAAAALTMKEVFTSWLKGGHAGSRWYGYDSGYAPAGQGDIGAWIRYNQLNGYLPNSFDRLAAADSSEMAGWRWADAVPFRVYGYSFWFFNQTCQALIQAANTEDDSFYVSPYSMTQYDVTVRCRSFDRADDDMVGMVAAMNVGSGDGARPHYLAFLRTPNGSNVDGRTPYYHWAATVDAAWPGDGNVHGFEPALSAQFFHFLGAMQIRFSGVGGNVSEYPKLTPAAKAALHEGLNYVSDVTAVDLNAPSSYVYNGSYGFWNAHPTSADLAATRRKVRLSSVVKNEDGRCSFGFQRLDEAVDTSRLSAPENWWWWGDAGDTSRNWCRNTTWGGSGHTYIRVKRDGDRLSAWTTRFKAGAPSGFPSGAKGDYGGVEDCPSDWNAAVTAGDAFLLTADLGQDRTVNGVNIRNTFSASVHPEGGAMGFVTCSQAGATWDVLSADIPKIIVRTDLNEVYRKNPFDDRLEKLDAFPADYCGRGRLCKNPATEKVFFVDDMSFTKIYDPDVDQKIRVVETVPPQPAPETYYFVVRRG